MTTDPEFPDKAGSSRPRRRTTRSVQSTTGASCRARKVSTGRYSRQLDRLTALITAQNASTAATATASMELIDESVRDSAQKVAKLYARFEANESRTQEVLQNLHLLLAQQNELITHQGELITHQGELILKQGERLNAFRVYFDASLQKTIKETLQVTSEKLSSYVDQQWERVELNVSAKQDKLQLLIKQQREAFASRLQENADLFASQLRKQQEALEEIGRNLQRVEGTTNHLCDSFPVMFEAHGNRLRSVETLFKEMEGVFHLAYQELDAAKQEALDQAERFATFHDVWKSTPLLVQLQFVRSILPPEHVLLSILKTAIELEEIRCRGVALNNWITHYPGPFADSINLLRSAQTEFLPGEGTSVVELLTQQVLRAAWTGLDTALEALGLRWITAVPGDAVTVECEVAGEEQASVEPGCVVRMVRPGFYWQGVLHLTTRVIRAVDTATATIILPDAAPTRQNNSLLETGSVDSVAVQAVVPKEPVASGAQQVPNQDLNNVLNQVLNEVRSSDANLSMPPRSKTGTMPEWLRTLQMQSMGDMTPLSSTLMNSLTELVALGESQSRQTPEELASGLARHLQPLRPLLPPRDATATAGIPSHWAVAFKREVGALVDWLKGTFDLDLIVPPFATLFDPETMEVGGIRKTIHTQEDQKVAKTEYSGVRYRGKVLFPARVQRYEISELL